MNRTKVLIIFLIIILIGVGVFYFQREQREIKEPIVIEEPEEIEEIEEKVVETLSCVIFDQEYCQKGEPVYDKDNNFVGLGFDLPDETKIYSPFNGLVNSAYAEIVLPNQLHQGFSIKSLETEEIVEFTVVGSVKTIIKPEIPYFPEEPERLVKEEVVKGQLVAQIDKSLGYQIVPISDEETIVIGGYDILINIWQLDDEINRLVRSQDKLTKLFNYVK